MSDSAGEIWYQALSQAGKNIGNAITSQNKQYNAMKQMDATVEALNAMLPEDDPDRKAFSRVYERYQQYSGRQKAQVAEGIMKAWPMYLAVERKKSDIAMPMYDESGTQIGTMGKTGVPRFFPKDIRHPEYDVQRQLAAVQKLLLSEIKTIENEFQKDYKTSPEAFAKGSGIEVIPGEAGTPASLIRKGQAATPASVTLKDKPIDAGTLSTLREKAQRHADLKQAVTTPDPMKTLGAIEWLRKNPNDPRAPKWREWLKSQLGSQGIVAPPPNDTSPDDTSSDDDTGD